MLRSIDRAAIALITALAAPTTAVAAGTSPDGTITCNIPQPCALYKNANGIGLSATSAKAAGVYGSTTFAGTSIANRAFGVEGVDASTNNNPFNAGLYGGSSHGYGLYASSPAGTAVYATSTSGTGVRAASTSGIAINAASGSNLALNATASSNTAVVGTTKSPNGAYAGVMGVDASVNDYYAGYSDGVLGITGQGGNYGVEGTSGNGAQGGVNGSATDGIGVTGTSIANTGVSGLGTTGVYGEGTAANSVLSPSDIGVYGTSAAGIGVFATVNSGTAVLGNAPNGDGLRATTASSAGVGVRSTNTAGNASDFTGSYIGLLGRSDSYPLVLTDNAGDDEFFVTGSGDIYVHGGYNTFVRTRSGVDASAFTTHSTTSSVEDSGTAELTAGVATVRFGAAFASAIDARVTYQVFLTPGGDTRGLYVASKSATGFVVRETQGGRGTLAFDYRILAAAMGHTGDRMAFVSSSSMRAPSARPTTRALPQVPAHPRARKRRVRG